MEGQGRKQRDWHLDGKYRCCHLGQACRVHDHDLPTRPNWKRIDSLSSALNSNAQFYVKWLLSRQWWLTPQRLLFLKGGVLELAQQLSNCVWTGCAWWWFLQWRWRRFRWVIFSYDVGPVTNSGVVFTWEVDPQHAEVGSDEPNKSNATFAHDEMEFHGQVHHSVSSRLFYLAFDPIWLHACAMSAVVQSGRLRVLIFHSVFCVFYQFSTGRKHCDVRWTVGRWYCKFARKRDVQHLEDVYAYGRSNLGCSRKRKTRSSGLRRMEAQSISYMMTFLRQVFGDFSAQVPQRQMGNESRRCARRSWSGRRRWRHTTLSSVNSWSLFASRMANRPLWQGNTKSPGGEDERELVRARATLQLARQNVMLWRAIGVFGELFDLCLDLLSFSFLSSWCFCVSSPPRCTGLACSLDGFVSLHDDLDDLMQFHLYCVDDVLGHLINFLTQTVELFLCTAWFFGTLTTLSIISVVLSCRRSVQRLVPRFVPRFVPLERCRQLHELLDCAIGNSFLLDNLDHFHIFLLTRQSVELARVRFSPLCDSARAPIDSVLFVSAVCWGTMTRWSLRRWCAPAFTLAVGVPLDAVGLVDWLPLCPAATASFFTSLCFSWLQKQVRCCFLDCWNLFQVFSCRTLSAYVSIYE